MEKRNPQGTGITDETMRNVSATVSFDEGTVIIGENDIQIRK